MKKKISGDAIETFKAMERLTYSGDCILGKCKRIKRCNSCGYCVIQVEMIQDLIDRERARAVSESVKVFRSSVQWKQKDTREFLKSLKKKSFKEESFNKE